MSLLALFNTLIACQTLQTPAPFLLLLHWEKGLLSLLMHSASSSSNSFSMPYCFHTPLMNFRILSAFTIWAQDQIVVGCFLVPTICPHVLLSHACLLLPSTGDPFECPLDKPHDGTQLCFWVLSASGLSFLACPCRDVTAKRMAVAAAEWLSTPTVLCC